jgi:hypothetical protein
VSTARVTDEQILELRGRLLRESGNQMTADTDACGAALRDPSGYPAHLRAVATFERDAGRARCAELIEGLVKEEASAHVHSWTPIPLATARYECSCGATGRREKSGEIVAQKADRRRTETSRRPLTWAGGRIAPKTGH